MLRARSRAAAVALAAAGVLLASAADARRFAMSGTWAMRRGSHFVPHQFAQGKAGAPWVHTSAGQLSKALLTPNGPVPGSGAVTASGSGPATLRVPQHRFGGSFSALVPYAGTTLVQLTTMRIADGPAAPATLAPDAGPGSFTWCPGDPACGATGPPGAAYGTGRIIYRAGANRFGGAMQMLLQGGGSASGVFQLSPLRLFHVYLTPSQALDSGIQHTGGAYANVVKDYLPRGFVTQPLVPPTVAGLITAPGPRVTTMLGVTGGTGSVNPTLRFPALATTPMGLEAGQIWTHTGFPFTTGTVVAQQSAGSSGSDFFTVMGSDMRTALGAGNIALVAGGLTRIQSIEGTSFLAGFGVVRMTLAPPVPSLSPAGVAACGLLLLLGVGYARSRRA